MSNKNKDEYILLFLVTLMIIISLIIIHYLNQPTKWTNTQHKIVNVYCNNTIQQRSVELLEDNKDNFITGIFTNTYEFPKQYCIYKIIEVTYT